MNKTSEHPKITPKKEENPVTHNDVVSSKAVPGEVNNFLFSGVAIHDFGFGGSNELATGNAKWPPEPTSAAQELGGGAMVFSDPVTDDIHAVTLMREKALPSEAEIQEAKNNLTAQMNSEKVMSGGWDYIDKEAKNAIIEKYNYWMVKTSYTIIYDDHIHGQINSITATKELIYLGYGLEATEPGNANVHVGGYNKYTKQVQRTDDLVFSGPDLKYEKSMLNYTFPVGGIKKQTAGKNYRTALFKEGKGFIDYTISRRTGGSTAVRDVLEEEMDPIFKEHEKNVKKAVGADDDTGQAVSLVLGWGATLISLIPVSGILAEAVLFWASQGLGAFSTAVGINVEDSDAINRSREVAVKKATKLSNRSAFGMRKFSYIGNNVYPK